MKKLLLITGTILITACAFAARPLQSVSVELWELVGDTLSAFDDRISVTQSGTLVLGQNSLQNWGATPEPYYSIFSYTDAASGIYGNEAYMAQFDSVFGGVSDADIQVSPDYAMFSIRSIRSQNSFTFVGMDVSEDAPRIWAKNGIGELMFRAENGTIETASPTDGQAGAWKLGSVVPATVQLVTDKYVQVEIGGQIVKLAVVE